MIFKKKSQDVFSQLAQQNKRRTLIKTSLLSLLLLLASLLCLYKVLAMLTARTSQTIYHNYEVQSQVAFPNTGYSTLYYRASSLFSGSVHSDRYRDIDGVPVAVASFDGYYSLNRSYNIDWYSKSYFGNMAVSNTSFLKEPAFFNTGQKADSEVDDTLLLDQNELSYIPQLSGQLVEMAITFDKAYSYKDIQEMIPDNLKINWLWIGTRSTIDSSQFSPQYLFGTSPDLLTSDSGQYFVSQLQKATTIYDGHNYGDYELVTDLDDYLKEDFIQGKEADNFQFAGVILTGKAEHFQALEGKDWIYASNIGITIDNQPYYKLDVE